MSIWHRLYGAIKGGWKTYGPNSIAGSGAFDSSSIDDAYEAVTVDSSLKLSALWACLNLRAETIGSLPLHIRDKDKNVLRDHDVYSLLHDSPNSMQTSSEYWSQQTAHVDIYGNGISVIERRSNGTPIALLPMTRPDEAQLVEKKSGRFFYMIDGEKFAPENVLHLKGFSLDGYWGLPLLDVGRHILSSQISANESAQRAFNQSLKVGGFFLPEHTLTTDQLKEFHKRLDRHGLPENNGKFLTLVKGMKPISGAEFRIKPSDAELLQSRYLGIEEICRLCRTPPQLIGHTDKASSWASSLEQINLFYLMYGLQPNMIRHEKRIVKSLLTPMDRARGYQPKFSIAGLLRSDLKTRQAFYASALQNGYMSINEVRELEDRAEIDGGDEHRVQLNMQGVTDPPVEPAGG